MNRRVLALLALAASIEALGLPSASARDLTAPPPQVYALALRSQATSVHTATAVRDNLQTDYTAVLFGQNLLISDGGPGARTDLHATGTYYVRLTASGAAGDCFSGYTQADADWPDGFSRERTSVSAGDVCLPGRPENCPIVLDLGMNGVHLSGTNPPVSFDINADGAPNMIAWTQAGSDDAFLCLDRNGNGRIDDGSELFGYATPLASGAPAVVGYRALAEFDSAAQGGNADGKIDAGDAIWSHLCVWRDSNRDGQSGPGEISPLSSTTVAALDYSYVQTGITDQYGNEFRYVSHAWMRRAGANTPARLWPTFDVIFASGPAPH